jgi:hypothetical protein
MRMIAMVATAQHTVLTFEAIRTEMLHRFAARPLVIEPVAADTSAAPDGLVLSVDGVLLTVLFIEQPIPAAELNEAIKGGRIGWPTAGEELAQHRAHVIVGMVNPADSHAGVFNGAACVTFVAAAVAALSAAIGVYWSSARAVRATPDFVRAAEGLAQRQIPTDTWVRLDFLQGSPDPADGIFAAVTIGLQPFVGRELEFEPERLSPRAIAQRIVGTAQYLIANGMMLNDGDTLEVDQNEQIRVRFAEQGQRPGVPVARLRVERTNAAQH